MMKNKLRAYDSQIVRAKENLKFGYGGSSQRQASHTNKRIKALCQGHHSGLTHPRAIKKEIIAINRDWVYNQACRLSHGNCVVPHPFIAFNYLFKLITKTRISNYFKFT